MSGDLKALSGFSADNIFAAGNNGSLIHFDGSAWQQVISGFDSDIQAMRMFSATEMFMSGKEGIIRQFTGNANNHSSLNRLVMERRRTSEGNVIYCIEYTFDDNSSKNGNIHRVVYDGKHVTEFTYNEMNELTGITHPDTSTETLTYDNNGNLTQTVNNTTGETTAYEWDCFDRLTKVILPAKGGATSGETVEFEYDSSGMLIGEKSGGMERKFTQQNRFATRELVKNRNGEWEMSAYHTIHGQMLATHISSNSKKAGMNKVSNETGTIFYHTDHLGSVRLITDQNGNIVDSSITDAYGNPLPRETANPNTPPGSPKNKGAKMLSEFNFIGTHGIRYVEKVKLHNMRARWYKGKISRFNSPDPFKRSNLIYSAVNYLYSDNNPIRYFDIHGLFTMVPTTKSNQNKLKCIMKKLKIMCPKAYVEALNVTFTLEHFKNSAELAVTESNGQIKFNQAEWNKKWIQETENVNLWAYVLMEEMIHKNQYSYFRSAPYGSSYLPPYINNIFDVGFPQPYPIDKKIVPIDWFEWLDNYSCEPRKGEHWSMKPDDPKLSMEVPRDAKVVIFETLAQLALKDELSRVSNAQTLKDVDFRLFLLHPRFTRTNLDDYDPYNEILLKIIELSYGKSYNIPLLLSRSFSPNEAYNFYCK